MSIESDEHKYDYEYEYDQQRIRDEIEELQRQSELYHRRAEQEVARLRLRQLRRQLTTGLIAIVFAFAGFFMVLFSINTSKESRLFAFGTGPSQESKTIRAMQAKFREVDTQFEDLNGKFSAVSAASDFEAKIQLEQLRQEIGGVDERLKRIESSISTDPERALVVPLLRKDVDFAYQRIEMAVEQVRALSGAIDSLQKLMIGGLGGILLAGLGWFVPALLEKNKVAKVKNDQQPNVGPLEAV